MLDTVDNPRMQSFADQPPPILIRRMRVADIENVSRIERRCYSLPWSSTAYVTEINNPSAYYTVAIVESGVVAGYAGMWLTMRETHITTIAVDPEYRGQRIGERLLIDMLVYGLWNGATRASLEVRERNIVAHHLYTKYGFVDMAIRKNYYSDNGENAVIMWADDLHCPELQSAMRSLAGTYTSLDAHSF